jgi:cellulose synthase/poly-beta-1,6-N-acetylglucosamine synthase-like glycosyltransferase
MSSSDAETTHITREPQVQQLECNNAFSRCQLAEPDRIGRHLKAGILPVMLTGRRHHAVAADADPDALAAAAASGTATFPASRAEIADFVEKEAPDALTEDAGQGLFERDRLNSALHGILPVQKALALLAAVILLVGFVFAPVETLLTTTALCIIVLLVLVIFRFVCMAAGMSSDRLKIDAAALAQLRDEDLPSYTVMVPMLREREATLRGLVASLAKLDYPKDRLQVQLILEETDVDTRATVDRLPLPDWFDVVLIPNAEPHTKGKACNYALYFARGERLTIYDAEDHPDPLQLKKAVVAFNRSGPDVVCAQSHLNFYNIRENWLTRLFTLDYTVWYDFMLPGLERLGVPICLGGTSNHFITSVVRELDGWDAYNVTEDADLGLRFARKGLRTIMLDSVTKEEANTRIGNWIRQRSRWMKGYMLTYLVHMRRPLALLRVLGPWRFAGVQLFVGGNFLGNLINVPLWGVTLLWASREIWGWTDQTLFPASFLYPALFCLVIGNAAALAFTALAAWRRGLYDLLPYVLTAPFYWEKTEHGLTTVALAEPSVPASAGPALTEPALTD